MFNLPRTTHRYLLEPLTEKPHVQFSIMKRFVNFCDQLRHSKKLVLNMMIKHCENNSQSKTGHNLRTILLKTEKTNISQIDSASINSQKYFRIPDGEEWRVDFLKELIEVRNDPALLENFSIEEIEDFIHFACTT